ncbi:MDC1 protein, partial [Dicrurus megarhynchus]|nr:MDC1 protein [Dicrurus megarhynchus]
WKTPNPDVSGPKMGCRMLLVKSDTDVEEEGPDPYVGASKQLKITQNVPETPDVAAKTPNPNKEGKGSDPDVATQLFPPPPDPDVGRPEAAPRPPRVPDVGQESPNPDVGGPPGPAREEAQALPTPKVRRSQRLAERRGGGASSGPSPMEKGHGQALTPCPSPKPCPQRRRSQAGEGLGKTPPSVSIKGSGQGSVATPPLQEEEPAGAAKYRLRPRAAPGPAPIRVLFTGLVASPALLVALQTLGGTEATSVHDCSHLVTDGARRTLKLLCALGRGIPIVTPEWLLQ